MAEANDLVAPSFQAGLSTRAMVAAVRYGSYSARDVYDDGRGTLWVKASAVWLSKKRFFMNHSLAAFEAAAIAEPRLDVFTDNEGVAWLRALPN